jgi:hypothetical protein
LVGCGVKGAASVLPGGDVIAREHWLGRIGREFSLLDEDDMGRFVRKALEQLHPV